MIGSPLFDRLEFDHGFGGKLIILAKNNSDKNIYIQSVKVNGKDYTKNWFQHKDRFKKGIVTIEFEMGNQPNYTWGTGASNIPSYNSLESL